MLEFRLVYHLKEAAILATVFPRMLRLNSMLVVPEVFITKGVFSLPLADLAELRSKDLLGITSIPLLPASNWF